MKLPKALRQQWRSIARARHGVFDITDDEVTAPEALSCCLDEIDRLEALLRDADNLIVLGLHEEE